jgi:hypothetical protein
MVLVDVRPVVVLTTSHTTTTRMLAVLADTTFAKLATFSNAGSYVRVLYRDRP